MRKHSKVMAIFSMAILTVGTLPTPIQATSCNDLEIVFARGSGAPVGTSADYQGFKSTLTKELTENASNLSYHFYDLGTSAQAGHQYPAVSIEDPSVLLGSYIGSGNAFAFGNSVKEGIAELSAYLDNISRNCPTTKFLLAGYSQGAMVLTKAIPELAAEKILYVATFGDPKLYLPEGKQRSPLEKPLACSGQNLSNYRLNVPDCEVESGILGAQNPYQLPAYINKLGAWCNEADFMCGSYFDLSNSPEGESYEGKSNPLLGILKAHLAYRSNDAHSEAAKVMLSSIAQAYPDKVTATSTNRPAPQNVAVLLDITGSMTPLLNQYRTEALKVAQKVKSAGGNVALYTYGDELREGTSPQLRCGYGCSLEEFQNQLNSISANGGDDDPESALSALLHVMNTMSWQRGANKSIILLTDASYHSVDVNGITLNDVVKRSYEIDPVNIFTITPDSIMPYYAELTERTGGKTFSSSDDFSLATTEILDRPPIHIGEVRYSDTPTAIIDNISVNMHGSTSAQISLTANHAVAYYLSINEAPLGLTQATSFTLTDLSPNSNLTLSITPINSDGRRGITKQVNLTTGAPQTDPVATQDTTTPAFSPGATIIKAPNSGAH